MQITVTRSCALGFIDGLINYPNQQHVAMVEFCKQALGQPNDLVKTLRNPLTYYVFSSGPEAASAYDLKTGIIRRPYGTPFANFIVENNLGEISTLPRRVNNGYASHDKDHTAQVWLWAPDISKIQAWWIEQLKCIQS